MKGRRDKPQHEDQAAKRPKQRKSVSSLASKKLYQEADNRCPFCGVADVAVLEIHHIDEDPSNTKIENLIVVCRNCHTKITCEEISPADVHAKKVELFWLHKAAPWRDEKSLGQSVNVDAASVSGSIIANTVTFGRKRSPRMQYPVDSIGADAIKKGYTDYLIKRYFDYCKADASYLWQFAPFQPCRNSLTIQRKFKVKTFFIHVSRFEELCDYINGRVGQTNHGWYNCARSVPNYGSFEEYEAEQLRHE
ncbi:HNH endonuclease [Candidatus Methylacidiphilum fumarolicum]|uniref:HNH nuclease domain-containing protein n=2 Tax=Candidatus Methylacidiphilum fumarolicum TaxID=591154 RepID=I0JXW4_METFB|nr:HNH endonuclease signature motif containing protein [Candidatus Methylacidiphilum fumarolicum]MBW6414177.1 HNH endonuclease [Candidatus Methylacidiphilum fumarolicum]TFE69990.1 hypothetical protein A7K73_05125 [Candidatus Methylacidiphilum fumarolicum]TFE73794.1 HNH endonuclease [Candidatus Methylacidiphilum fumarolicum]TFE75600.1 HNH endonuclease [Candidatus Methylacidiphilum fumarolicum]TFE76764.1 hypothetical protein A7D33_08220 [Candidatus Methylacidiphilum fumarolicum]